MSFSLRNVLGLSKNYKKSFSQNGEDIIIQNILQWLNIDHPVFMDVGTYHPSIINNTYLLYLRGCQGLCIEPNPTLFAEIKKIRKRDICLNVGVSNTIGKAIFYVMSNGTLSTMDKEQALHFQRSGESSIEKEIEIEILTVESIIQQYLNNKVPHFITMDIEGLDLQVLETIDFNKYRPQVLCLETKDAYHNKNNKMIEFMKERDYFVCADTYINSIFVDQSAWNKRKY